MKTKTFPWFAKDETESAISGSWPMDVSEESKFENSDSSYCFTTISRPVEWWKENEIIDPIDENYLYNQGEEKNYVRIEDVWIGRVLQDSQDFFVAKLTNQQSTHSDRIVKIWKQKIDQTLWGEVHEGATFDWTFGKRYTGVAEHYQKMVFRPNLNLDIDDMDRMVNEMIKGFEDIFKEPTGDDSQSK